MAAKAPTKKLRIVILPGRTVPVGQFGLPGPPAPCRAAWAPEGATANVRTGASVRLAVSANQTSQLNAMAPADNANTGESGKVGGHVLSLVERAPPHGSGLV